MMKKWIQCNLNILFNDSDGRIKDPTAMSAPPPERLYVTSE